MATGMTRFGLNRRNIQNTTNGKYEERKAL